MAKKLSKSAAKVKAVESVGAVALELMVSERTVHTWLAQGCPGANAQGEYSIDRIRAWRDEHKKPARKGTEEDRDSTSKVLKRKLEADALKAEEDARAKKLKNDLLEGSLLQRDEVLQQVAAEFARVKIRLEQFPDEMENDFPRKDRARLKSILDHKIELLLHQLADFSLESETEEATESDDDE